MMLESVQLFVEDQFKQLQVFVDAVMDMAYTFISISQLYIEMSIDAFDENNDTSASGGDEYHQL